MAVQKTIGGTMITGDHIELFQMKAQLAALKLEMLGLRHSSGRSMYAALKRRYNLHGTKQSVADQFAALIAEMEQPAEHTKDSEGWPTCKHCGSHLGDDDELDQPDEETGTCDACQREPQRWKNRTATA